METDLYRGCIVVCLSEKPFDEFLDLVEKLKGQCDTVDSQYLALLTDSSLDATSAVCCNMWLKCMHSSATATLTATPTISLSSARPHFQYMTWEDLTDQLTAIGALDITKKKESRVSNEIHYLLDHLPWGSDDYVLMNVIVTIPAPSASASTELYGALLRLRTWNNATIYFVVCGEDISNGVVPPPADENDSSWKDLSDCLPAYIGPLSTVIQKVSPPTIWKGHMRVPEQRTKYSQTPSALVLPGYVLSFLEPAESIPKSLFSATGLNISHTHHPSHLELIQVVDIRDIPLVWLSPLTVKLSIEPAFCSSPSGVLFKELFQSSSSPYTGVLLRLYMRGGSGEHRTQHEYSTDQWRLHILEKEVPSGSVPLSAVSSSLSDYPGPLLLALPHSGSVNSKLSKSCDARLLWKQTAMDNVAGTLKKLLSIKTMGKKDDTGSPHQCDAAQERQDSQERILSDHFVPYTREMLLGDMSKLRTHELIGEPSQWPEIIALHNLESMLRKQIKRKSTSELTLGGMTAPPPTGTSSLPTDLLECFTESGMPRFDLSPVAMNDGDREDIHPLHMMDPNTLSSSLTYNKLLDSTPTTARKYHGVSYCFTEEDFSRDSKLTKVQKRYVSSERSCNCSNYQTPVKNQELKNRKKLAKAKKISKESESHLRSEKDSLTKPPKTQTDTSHPQTKTNLEISQHSEPDVKHTHSKPDTRDTTLSQTDTSDINHTQIQAPPQFDTDPTESQSEHFTDVINPQLEDCEGCHVSISESNCYSESASSRSRKGRKNKDPIRSVSREELESECCQDDTYKRLKLSKARRSLNVSKGEIKYHQGGVALSSQNTGPPSPSLPDHRDGKDSVDLCPKVTGSEITADSETSQANNKTLISHVQTPPKELTVDDISSSKEVPRDLIEHSVSSGQGLTQPSYTLNDPAGTEEDNKAPPPVTNSSSSSQDKQTNTVNQSISSSSSSGSNKNLKKVLERSIASSLKSRGMKRGHQCFKSCYIRLFKIAKVYVKDLKPTSAENVREQINRIVDFNVQQVIDFELSNQATQNAANP